MRLRRYDRFVERQPSFLAGFASVFDLAGALAPRRYEPTPDADARALASDWEAVGRDMWVAVRRFEDETGIDASNTD